MMEYVSDFPSEWSMPASSSSPERYWYDNSDPVATSIFTPYKESDLQEAEVDSDLAFYRAPGLACQRVITRDFAYRAELSRIEPVTTARSVLGPSNRQDEAIDEPRKVEIKKRADFTVQERAQAVPPDGRIARYDTEFPQDWRLPPLIKNSIRGPTTVAVGNLLMPGLPDSVAEERFSSNSSTEPFPRLTSSHAQAHCSLEEAPPYLHRRRSKLVFIPREQLEDRRNVVTESGDAPKRKMEEGSAAACLIEITPMRWSVRDTPPKHRRASSGYSNYMGCEDLTFCLASPCLHCHPRQHHSCCPVSSAQPCWQLHNAPKAIRRESDKDQIAHIDKYILQSTAFTIMLWFRRTSQPLCWAHSRIGLSHRTLTTHIVRQSSYWVCTASAILGCSSILSP